MTEEDRVRLRHTDRRVGALVLLAVAVFLGTLFQRSVIREWFAGGSQLVVLLPEEGVAGLSEGAEAEVLGVRAGSVQRIVVEPAGRIRAVLRIEDQARVFIRRDSEATVRRRFGVAGPSYLDISRGQGPPLDWEGFAVIDGKVEPAATETAGALLEDLRRRIFPILDDLQRGMHAFAAAAERLERGEGTVGRLLADDTLAREAEAATARATALLATAEEMAVELRALAATLSGETPASRAAPDGSLPSLLLRADRSLAAVERATRDLPRTTRNLAQASEPLPAVVVQAQRTARELELLATRLRGSWLLGGEGGPPPREALRPPADRVRP
jgi:phospholipid/cholesterol/gamma-HCH transport system substrate-binding protein